jgi:glutathione S-transferase
MKLFSSPTSPYARKVRVLIIELGLGDDIEVLSTLPMEDPQDLHAANPVGKVPTLMLSDDRALYDSPVICEYLDARKGFRFLPESGDRRWDCLRRQALGDGVLDAAFSRTAENNKGENERSQMWFERWSNAINRSLEVMSRDLEISGERFDLGDVTFGCALGYLDLRHGDMNWREGRTSLAQWYEKVSARPSFNETVPG